MAPYLKREISLMVRPCACRYTQLHPPNVICIQQRLNYCENKEAAYM